MGLFTKLKEKIKDKREENKQKSAANKARVTGAIKAKIAQWDADKKAIKSMGKKGLKLIPLIPYKPLMVMALKAKGVTPSASFPQIVNQFYDNVVKTSSTFDEWGERGEHDNLVLSAATAATIASVAKGVWSFIKEMVKKKKENPESLSETEAKIADAAETIKGEVDESYQSEYKAGVGAFLSDNILYIIIGAVILGIIIMKAKK